MAMHMTPFRSLPADPAWGAGCVACLRSLPMRDRARAMRPARYVGPAGKERCNKNSDLIFLENFTRKGGRGYLPIFSRILLEKVGGTTYL